MTKSPAFQFYPDDFLGSGKVGQMTIEEIGVFVMLLCLDWSDGGFVLDTKRLARWCKVSPRQFSRCWKHVSLCFDQRDGRMYNPRLELERQKQKEWREKSSDGGKKGALARWGNGDKGGHKGGDEMVITTALPNDDTPSPIITTTTDAAVKIVAAVNKGLANHEVPQRQQPIPRITPTSGSTFEALTELSAAGVPLDFAVSELYEAARRNRAEGVVSSLKYFTPRVIAAWKRQQAQSDAESAPIPPANEVPRAAKSEIATRVWDGIKRTNLLFAHNRDEWLAGAAQMQVADEAESVEWLETLWKKLDVRTLQAARSDHFAIQHIREMMTPTLRIA